MGKKVLIVDDSRSMRWMVNFTLDENGYEVTEVENGKDGLDKLGSAKPELIITDMMMPKMGGFPVLEHLQTLDNPPHVIMITANEGGRHKAYAEMLGVAAYLRKPFAMDLMLETIEEILNSDKKAKPKGKKKK